MPSNTSVCTYSTFIFSHLCSSFYSSAGGIASSVLFKHYAFSYMCILSSYRQHTRPFHFVTFPRSLRIKWKQIVSQFSPRRHFGFQIDHCFLSIKNIMSKYIRIYLCQVKYEILLLMLYKHCAG